MYTAVTRRGSVAAGAAVIFAGTLVSRILGFGRETSLAAVFGASPEVDAYLVAHTIPVMLFGLVSAGVGLAFVPIYRRRLNRDLTGAFCYANAVLTILGLLVALTWVLSGVMVEKIIRLMAPGLSPTALALSMEMTLIMLPAMLALAISEILAAMLQADSRFGSTAVSNVITNIVIIGSIWMSRTLGIRAVAVGTLIGIAIPLVNYYVPLHRMGYRYRFQLGFDADVRETARTIWPLAIANGAGQVALVIDRMMASRLPPGSIAALSYANRIYTLPALLVGASIATAIYPRLAEHAAQGDKQQLGSDLNRVMKLLALLMCPAMTIFVVLRVSLVRVFLQHGVFTPHDTQVTAFALLFLAFGIPAQSLADVIRRFYYSCGDTVTPMWCGMAGVVTVIAGNLTLVAPLAQGGLALSVTLSLWVQVLLLLAMTRPRLGLFAMNNLGRTVGASLVAGGAMAGMLVTLTALLSQPLLGSGFVGEAFRLAVIIGAGGLIYVIVLSLMRVPEVTFAIAAGREQLRRLTRRAAMHKEPIRLVHMTTVPVSLKFLTGQARFMRAAGMDVHAISTPGPQLDEFGRREGVTVHGVTMARRITPVQDLVALIRLVFTLRRIRPHVVHAHTPKGGLLGMLAAWLVGTPVRFYHVHGLPFVTATGLRRRLLWWTEKISCKLAHQVFAVSFSLRDVAVAEGLCAPAKINVLGNGSVNGLDAVRRFNPDRFDQGYVQQLRFTLGLPEGAPVIGFVGRLVKDKGLAELLNAWRSLRRVLPEAHLLVVGPFEPQDPIPPDDVRELHADPRIHLTGEVQEPAPYYTLMDVLALPSYREGFGLVALEAAAMKIPVVATAIPGCVDAVEDGVTGTLVPPYSAVELGKALKAYLCDSGLRSAHGSAGRRRTLSNFAQPVIWEALRKEYHAGLNRAGIAKIDPPGVANREGPFDQ